MKTKTELSQIELATLASHLPTGSAKERVMLAFEIWQEARNPLAVETAVNHRLTSQAIERSNALDAAIDVPFEWLLADLMPKAHLSQRLEQWERFILWKMEHARESGHMLPRKLSQAECKEIDVSFGSVGQRSISPEDRLSEADLQKLTKLTLTGQKRDGVKHFLKVSDEFKKWEIETRKATATDKASTGGNARWHVGNPLKTFGKSKSLSFDEIVKRNISAHGWTEKTARKWAQTWKDCRDIEEISPGKFALRS